MITVKHHESIVRQVQEMSELELDQLLQDLKAHLYKNHLSHLITNIFIDLPDLDESLDELSDEISSLEEKLETAETDNAALQAKVDDATEILEELRDEEFGEDWGREKIEETINILKS